MPDELLVFFKKGRIYIYGLKYNGDSKVQPYQATFEDVFDKIACDKNEKAISLTRDIGPFALKGDIFHLMENFNEAENAYKKFRMNIQTAIGFGNLYLLQGKLEELKTMLERGQALQTPLAHLYLNTKEFDKALREFDKRLDNAVKNDNVTGHIFMLYHKGLAYLGLKSISEAKKTAEELRELIQDSLLKKLIRLHYHLMGMIELKRENYPKATDYFQKAISLLPYTRDGRREYRPLFINSLSSSAVFLASEMDFSPR